MKLLKQIAVTIGILATAITLLGVFASKVGADATETAEQRHNAEDIEVIFKSLETIQETQSEQGKILIRLEEGQKYLREEKP